MSTTTRHHHDDSARGLAVLGVSAFAGVMLANVALFQVLQGIAAIGEDDVFVSGARYTYDLDVSTWGWIHLVLGLAGLATGVGILLGQAWARLVGIGLASLGAVTSFAFLPYLPGWSLAILAFDGLVIWALCVQIARDAPR